MVKKILVIGSGFLGGKIIEESTRQNIETIGTNFSQLNNNTKYLDVRDITSISKNVKEHNPDFIINCAALTNIDFLEKNPQIGYDINARGAENVSIVAHETGSKLIHISTDSVFDGNSELYVESDNPNPINEYAKSKVLGEELIQKKSNNYIIIRTNFLGIDEDNKFTFSSIFEKLKNNIPIIGFYDVLYTPVEISDLSKWILDISETKYNGILHLSSDEIISKYQICVRIAETFGFSKKLIEKGSIDKMKMYAKRPKNTSLKNDKAKKISKISLLSFEDILLNAKKHKL